jgi:hypothetical protein
MMNQPHPFKLIQVFCRVRLQLLVGNLKVRFERIHNAFDVNSRWARLDGDPDTGADDVKAVAKALVDVEQHRSVCGICRAHLRRNCPHPSVDWFHLRLQFAN